MADTDAVKEVKQFYEDIPAPAPGCCLKGAASLDWGMKSRLARIFNPQTARQDVGELAADLCGPFFAKTTGAQIPVDGGNVRVI
jgi:3-hydroxy-5-phosphonooxypentane-2,4-dione thiolase